MAPSLLWSYLAKTAKIAVLTHTDDPYGSAYQYLALSPAVTFFQSLFLSLFKISSRFIDHLPRYS